MELPFNKILQGDCLEKLKELPENSIDLICTDPPYGIGFMGKEWDTFKPDFVSSDVKRSRGKGTHAGMESPAQSAARYDHTPGGEKKFREWFTDISVEMLRVLKPGAFAFVCIGARQDSVSAAVTAMTEAGFKTDFTSLFWTYASGFPKAMNIGKMVDKRRSCDVSSYIKNSGKTDSEIAVACEVSSALVRFWRTNERQIMNREWQKLKQFLKVEDEQFDLNLSEVEREVLGKTNRVTGKSQLSNEYGFGNSKNPEESNNLTAPATEQAKALDGSYGGFQPKPAVEVVIVAMKPLSEKTYVDQALKNGKGITWLDDCRIPAEIVREGNPDKSQSEGYGAQRWQKSGTTPESGRFPANLLVSDDVLNDGRVTKSVGGQSYSKNSGIYGKYANDRTIKGCGFGDSGSYSRYFDLDKWAETLPFLVVSKASKKEKSDYNIHPTCKPLKLMAYLITLGSREGDVILDPFAGSGTTAVAAKELNRKYIGIEREEEYVRICEARLKDVQPTLL